MRAKRQSRAACRLRNAPTAESVVARPQLHGERGVEAAQGPEAGGDGACVEMQMGSSLAEVRQAGRATGEARKNGRPAWPESQLLHAPSKLRAGARARRLPLLWHAHGAAAAAPGPQTGHSRAPSLTAQRVAGQTQGGEAGDGALALQTRGRGPAGRQLPAELVEAQVQRLQSGADPAGRQRAGEPVAAQADVGAGQLQEAAGQWA